MPRDVQGVLWPGHISGATNARQAENRAAGQADFKTELLRHRSGAEPESLHFSQAPRGWQCSSTVAHILRSTGLKMAGGTARSRKGAWMESDIDNI